jgi:hypothetical protein
MGMLRMFMEDRRRYMIRGGTRVLNSSCAMDKMAGNVSLTKARLVRE